MSASLRLRNREKLLFELEINCIDDKQASVDINPAIDSISNILTDVGLSLSSGRCHC